MHGKISKFRVCHILFWTTTLRTEIIENIQLSYLKEGKNQYGKIFEVDGHHHTYSEYQYYDKYRDEAAETVDFETIRFSEGEIKAGKIEFEKLLDEQEYTFFEKNFQRNIIDFKKEYALIFIPLAVARIQKTILEYLLGNESLLDKEILKIAIVERDLPCGAIAVSSLSELLINLNGLLKEADKIKIPHFEVFVFGAENWLIDESLNEGAKKEDESYFRANEAVFDLVIDHSILRRSNTYIEPDFKSKRSIKIRSSHYSNRSFGNMRRVYCADSLNYAKLVEKEENGSYTHIADKEPFINYFLKNIFRKPNFREGQLPIISRAIAEIRYTLCCESKILATPICWLRPARPASCTKLSNEPEY